jgi:hypothetical protein
MAMSGQLSAYRKLAAILKETARVDIMRFTAVTGADIELADVPIAIKAHGVVLFEDADVSSLRSALSGWTTPYAHPHETAPGLTLMSADLRDGLPGLAGFTRHGLPPHTDRASSDAPPTLMAMVILEPPESGGHSVLLDTAPVVRGLKRHASFDAMISAAFIKSGQRRWPILERSPQGRHRVRFRDDEIANPHTTSRAGEVLLRALKTQCPRPRMLEFGSGEGYLVHNSRYLHGRQEFRGRRVAARFLVDTRLYSLDAGFEIIA